MSGSSGVRDDSPSSRSSGSGARRGKQPSDPCQNIWRGPINSPKAAVLAPLAVGTVLGVDIQLSGTAPILIVTDPGGQVAGSLTFIGYLEIIDCIQNRGATYKATIINVSGGVYEVRVEPN